MKKTVCLWQLLGFAFTSFFGTLLHFLFEWTSNSFVALFSNVNESTWEHMKLIFFPMFIFAIVESFFIGKDYESFWLIKLRGILLGLSLIPILFYTISGIFGSTPDFINIAIFFVSAAASYIYETRAFLKKNSESKSQGFAVAVLCFIAVLFWVFTFMPPKIPLFEDPITKLYGIK